MRDGSGLRMCPFCKEQIREEALKCRFCGEWFDEASVFATVPEPDAKSTDSGNPAPTAPAVGSANLPSQGADAAPSTPTPTPPCVPVEAFGTRARQGGSWKAYWYGYLYMAFWGYLTLCAAGGLLASASKPSPSSASEFEKGIRVGGLVAGAFSTALFALITYTIALRRVRMRLVFALVTLHGIIMLVVGMSLIQLIIWVALSWIVLGNFSVGYELLAVARTLETKGQIQEALAAYRGIAEKYSHTAVGQDALKSIQSLRSKLGGADDAKRNDTA